MFRFLKIFWLKFKIFLSLGLKFILAQGFLPLWLGDRIFLLFWAWVKIF
jgi:hypothetical protein